MRTKILLESNPVAAALLSVAVAASLVACGGGSGPQSQEKPGADAPPAAAAASQAELDARAEQLALREAELAAKEQELADAREQAAAEAAERERAAAAKAAASPAAVAKTRPPKSSTPAPSSTEAVKAPPPPPKPVELAAGTQLTLALSNGLSSKTAKPGDPFEARLVSDLIVDDRRALPAGTRAKGTISKVVSGSDKIGAIPTLELKFDHLELADGRQIPISGQLTQVGKSEKGRDAAKIIGGVAAGAIVGSQVKKGGTGTIVGGLLGGAAGAVVAKNTGTEVELADGSTLTITLDQSISVPAN